MAVRRRRSRRPNRRDLTPGAKVRSIGVGRKEAFNGVVIGWHPPFASGAYVVEDEADGSRWHRDPSELAVLHD